MNSGLRRIGIIVLIIGVLIAITGSITAGLIGINEGHWLEMIRAVAICLIGGLLCWAGSELIGLSGRK